METKTFAELGLSQKVQAAIQTAGYTTPTPIQSEAIPFAVAGRDVLGIAQTGTGKTASFVLPMITRLETGRARARMPRSLILAPTRELAAQCADSFEKYGINHKLSVALLIGGVSMDDQVKKLDRGVDVLIATPGRLLDHFQRGRVMLMGVEILVIDEADRMLDMGFIPDIEKICRLLPPKRQTLFFSATMPAEITRLVNTFLNDPVRVEVTKAATAATTITQLFRFCPNSEDWAKREVLRQMIQDGDVKNAIIFCNRKRDVAILLKSLLKHGFNAGALHGDMDQKSRMDTLDRFRSGEITLLAASDVAARGLDIPDVSHVFNFDLPWQSDDYVHRIGRTGRAGKEGTALSIVTPDDLGSLKDIEKMLGHPVTWMGDGPSEDDFANAGRRRGRGRFGRGVASRDSGRRESRPSHGRPERSGGERRPHGGARADRNSARPAGHGDEAQAGAQQPQPREERQPHRHEDRQPQPRAERSPREQRDRHLERAAREAPHQERAAREAPRQERAAREAPRQERPAREAPHQERAAREAPHQERAAREAPHQERAAREAPHQERAAREAPHQERAAREAPHQERAAREAPRQAKPQQPRERQQGRSGQPAAGGFADNVPAFLKRPARPAKVASE